jgi:hypothetical protein
MDPEQLLFTAKAGNRADLQDVICDGLDVDYSDRYPALEQLLASGTPAHRQTASLLGPLTALDDERAARAAEALLAANPRVVNEVAYSLRHGTGNTTLAILERLAKTNQIARESLGKRRPSK